MAIPPHKRDEILQVLEETSVPSVPGGPERRHAGPPPFRRSAHEGVTGRHPYPETGRRRAFAYQFVFSLVAVAITVLFVVFSSSLGFPAGCDGDQSLPSWISDFRGGLLPYLVGEAVFLGLFVLMLLWSRKNPGAAYWGAYLLSFPLGLLNLSLILGGPYSQEPLWSCWQLSTGSSGLLSWIILVAFLASMTTYGTTLLGLPVEERGDRVRGVLFLR